LRTLALASLGVVFGDIGTSPLYAMRECLNRAHGISTSVDNVFGIVSLVFWALMIVISLKYVAYVLRADNAGEGGVLALTALATRSNGLKPGRSWRWRSAYSAPRCCSVTASSRRPCRCSAPWKAWASRHPRSSRQSCRSRA
jgi:hypothetical protein